jgi:uncharacterized membrane protein
VEKVKEFLQRPWLYLFIIIIGVSVKFYHIDYRYFWYDELETILHTSGIPDYTYNSILPKNEIHSIEEYNELLRLNKQDYSIGEQLKGISKLTNLNPFHYALLVFWHRLAGDKDLHYRLFNVFLFLLTLPFLFFLAKILFKSDLAGWIAVCLFSASPFFHFYAHEARYNMLCTFLLVASHYFLLKAFYQNKLKWWLAYWIAGSMLLYATILGGIAIIGHLFFVVFFKKEYRLQFGLSALGILLVYSPWLVSVFNHRQEILGALQWHTVYGNLSFIRLLVFQLLDISNVFVNFVSFGQYYQLILHNQFHGNIIEFTFNCIVFLLILYGMIQLFRQYSKEISWFLLLSIIPFYLYMYVSDLVRGAGMSLYWRYHLIYYVGILLAMAGFLSSKREQKHWIWISIFSILIILGFVSIYTISQDRYREVYFPAEDQVACMDIISGSENPLLISDFAFWAGIVNAFLTISNECECDNVDILYVTKDVQNVEDILKDTDYSEIFVAYLSYELTDNLKSQFGERMNPVEIEGISALWQININNKDN